jgi:acetyltransferase-like isoleucine patch superfamily enzyme
MNVPFYVEQVNPNDINFKVLARHVENYKKVLIGDLIFDLEGQKATVEINAEKEGFLYTPYMVGGVVESTDIAYYICDSQSDCFELGVSLEKKAQVKITIKTEKLEPTNDHHHDSIVRLNDPVIRIAVLPGGRAYRQIQDAVQGNPYVRVVGYFDDADRIGSDYLGKIDFELILNEYINSKFDRIFVATGNSKFRTKLINKIAELGLNFINIIHPSSFVSNDAVLGCNIYVGPFVQIASRSIVSDGVFISAGSNIEHHCYISENCLLGPGVYLSGGVRIGNRSVLSAGVSVESNINIGDNVYITSGKGINKNIKNNTRLID